MSNGRPEVTFAIWKYPLEVKTEPNSVLMPHRARVLSVQDQKGVLTLWALVDPKALKHERLFHVRGTGHAWKEEVSSGRAYGSGLVGTVQQGDFVWHVFEANFNEF